MKNKKLTKAEILVIALTFLVVSWLSWLNFEKGKAIQRDGVRKTDLERIKWAIDSYFEVYGIYPKNSGDFEILGCGSEAEAVCKGGQEWRGEGIVYLEKFPIDPAVVAGLDWPNYGYQASRDQSQFWFWIFLERESDPDLASSQKQCPGSWQKNQYLVCSQNQEN
jgi:hypothetical protein